MQLFNIYHTVISFRQKTYEQNKMLLHIDMENSVINPEPVVLQVKFP